MGQQTRIEWCDHTFNPWRGCAKPVTTARGWPLDSSKRVTVLHWRELTDASLWRQGWT